MFPIQEVEFGDKFSIPNTDAYNSTGHRLTSMDSQLTLSGALIPHSYRDLHSEYIIPDLVALT